MANAKKVLFLHHGGGQGGGAVSLLDLIRHVDPARYQPIVACSFTRPHARDYLSRYGIQPIDLPIAEFAHMTKTWALQSPRGIAKLLQWMAFSQPAAVRALDSALGELQPDLVHFNGLSLLPLAPTVARRGIPVVQHVREPVNPGTFGLRRRWLEHTAANHASHVIFICSYYRRLFRVAGNTNSIVYDPVNFDQFRHLDNLVYRAKINISHRDIVLFFPGGSSLDIKGIKPFLQALSLLRTSHREVCALVPGLDTVPHPRDTFRKEIERLISTEHLEDNLRRVPFLNEVEQYYAASDVVVAPFTVPHFSRAVIEGGGMRLPVVGSRMDPISEVLVDGVTGLLARPGDAKDLARKIEILIDNPQRARAMGDAGYVRARELFDAKKHGRYVMDIYDRVLKGR